jgi:hypothetical protein
MARVALVSPMVTLVQRIPWYLGAVLNPMSDASHRIGVHKGHHSHYYLFFTMRISTIVLVPISMIPGIGANTQPIGKQNCVNSLLPAVVVCFGLASCQDVRECSREGSVQVSLKRIEYLERFAERTQA